MKRIFSLPAPWSSKTYSTGPALWIGLWSLVCSLWSVVYGETNVYFNKSVDTTLAIYTPAQGEVNLADKLITRISNAQYSIDFCFYDISYQEIVDSLVSACNRGVAIRVITDDSNRDTQEIQRLENANIPVIDDSYGDNSGCYLMHNKFAVFDYQDPTDTTDDWIWTGSYNTTFYGTFSNANNGIELRSHKLAEIYTQEFNQMWGSEGTIPNPDNSCFGTHKSRIPCHSVIIDSTPVEVYFSPKDDACTHITDLIETANKAIHFCVFVFTRQDMCNTMKERWDNGVEVSGVFDHHDWLGYYSKSRDMTGDVGSPNPWHPPAPVYCDSVYARSGHHFLHHKYLIIDPVKYESIFHGVDPDTDPNTDLEPVVITGSMNWSSSGNNKNDENILIIHSPDIANQFYQEFVKRFQEAGGSLTGIIKLPERMGLKASPNPFSTTTVISYSSSVIGRENPNDQLPMTNDLCIYDLSGRLIKSFVISHQASGEKPTTNDQCPMTVTWDARDEKSGIYFASSQGEVLKLILLKRKYQ